MIRTLLYGFGFFACVSLLFGQEEQAEERIQVEVAFATDNVPKNAKVGDKVDLKMVLGKTRRPGGGAVYQTRPVASGLEIAAVEVVKKPEEGENSVRLELWMSRQVAGKLEKVREQKVQVVEQTEDGRVLKKMVPIPLLLEPARPAKKITSFRKQTFGLFSRRDGEQGRIGKLASWGACKEWGACCFGRQTPLGIEPG